MKRFLACLVAVACLLAAFACVLAEEESVNMRVIKCSERVNIREYPNTNSTIVGKAPLGAILLGCQQSKKAPDWYAVIYDGVAGYIRGDFLEPVGDTAAPAEEAPVEEAPVEEAPAEEAPAEEPAVEEPAPAEEAPAEEEVPAEEEAPAEEPVLLPSDEVPEYNPEDEVVVDVPIDGEVEPVEEQPAEEATVAEEEPAPEEPAPEEAAPEETAEEGEAVTATDAATGDLAFGSSGVEVLQMQRRLSELGYLHANPDGGFGGMTQTALEEFQQAAGLAVTGVADSETLAALYADAAPAAPSAIENPPIASITDAQVSEYDTVVLDADAGSVHVIARRIFDGEREYMMVAGLDADGNTLWQQETATSGITELTCTDAFLGGIAARPLVMLYNAEVGLSAIDPTNGSVRWLLSRDDTPLGGGICHAVGGNGILYVGGYYGPDPVAIDANGTVLWQSDSGSDDIYWLYDIELTADGIVCSYDNIGDSGAGTVIYDYSGNVKGAANE